jgi:hypothetical protein
MSAENKNQTGGVMKGLLFLVVLFSSASVWANEFYSPAPGFTIPDGDIAYLGAYYEPLVIWDGGDHTKRMITRNAEIPPAAKAVSEFQAALIQNAPHWKLNIQAAPVSLSDQRDLLAHLLHPAEPEKYPFALDKLLALASGKPYALIGFVDYYGSFGSPVKIIDQVHGMKLNYMVKRSYLEQEGDIMVKPGLNRVGAFELLLVSTKDGSVLWQANGCDTIEFTPFNSYWDTANHETDEFLKNLSGKN